MKSATTSIHLAITPRDRRAVIEYTERKYLSQFGSTPGETKLYIYAEKEGQIVASAGLDFAQSNGKMPLEHLYTIDRGSIPLPLDNKNGVQICRLIADDPIVSSLPLVYASSVYAMRLGKSYAWLNHSDPVHRVFTRKGMSFVAIPDAELILENVSEGDLPFYTNPPFARCYIMPLQPAAAVLLPKVKELVETGIISFSSDFS